MKILDFKCKYNVNDIDMLILFTFRIYNLTTSTCEMLEK